MVATAVKATRDMPWAELLKSVIGSSPGRSGSRTLVRLGLSAQPVGERVDAAAGGVLVQPERERGHRELAQAEEEAGGEAAGERARHEGGRERGQDEEEGEVAERGERGDAPLPAVGAAQQSQVAVVAERGVAREPVRGRGWWGRGCPGIGEGGVGLLLRVRVRRLLLLVRLLLRVRLLWLLVPVPVLVSVLAPARGEGALPWLVLVVGI